MDREEMIRRIESGEPLIDITIDKWKDIIEGTGICLGVNNCALCYAYIREKCENCPICKFTGHRSCDDTPFREWFVHYIGHHLGEEKYDVHLCTVCNDISNREVIFLEKVKAAAGSSIDLLKNDE